MKILLVEDDAATAQFLSATLTADQYAVDVATDGQTGLELAKQWEYDLIVLDVMIPKLDGISVCRQLRGQESQTPILLLTAKGSNQDIVTGLDAGADDYLTKPFDLSQLLARIRALLRRRGAAPSSLVLTWGELTLDMVSTQVTYQQQAIDLRPREYKLLELLLRHPLRVFSRNAIIDQIWTSNDFPTEGAVTNLIKDLRQRFKRAGVSGELIETVYGLGYRLKASPEKKSIVEPPTYVEPLLEKTQQGIVALAQAQEWFQASLKQRIHQLEQVEQGLQQGFLSEQQRNQAKEELHKLIGGLGTFGYVEGVEFVRHMEALLSGNSVLEARQIQDFSHQLAELKRVIAQPPADLGFSRGLKEPISLPDSLNMSAATKQLAAGIVPASSTEPPEVTVIVIGNEATLSRSSIDLLQPWGIRIIYVNSVDRFWEVLTTITLELLLLDAEMETLDSIEFCQTIRRDLVQRDLPIIILTDRADLEFIQQIFAVGVNDFIRKPIIGTEFVSRVLHCIERSQAQRQHLQTDRSEESQRTQLDPLTQLYNRRYFEQSLQQVWMQQTALALVLCNVDHFALYHDRYGNTTGNICLQQIARVLQRSVDPAKSVVARYGPEEFAILLMRTNLDEAVRVAQTIQQEMTKLNLMHDRLAHLQVTVSIGITGTTPALGKTVEALLDTADQAVHAAKWRGGNTYCLYPL
ncbi:MAG: response regulator [Elainella sp. Prado103]|jgi:diguanylate cyclase (GGDEF)-like protein|nr:response regulator [Elainella sp. Prado103]